MQLLTILSLAVIGCLAISTPTFADNKEDMKIQNMVMNMNLMGSCWGQMNTVNFMKRLHSSMDQCMAQKLTYNPGNGRTRPAGLPGARQRVSRAKGDEMELLQSIGKFQNQMMASMGNLTCVLQNLGILDRNMNVVLKYFTEDSWKNSAESFDKDFMQVANEGYDRCYQKSMALKPELEFADMMKQAFGKQLIFFHCAGKMEKKLCVQQQQYRFYKAMYGELSPQVMGTLSMGQKTNKFSLASSACKIRSKSRSNVEKFVIHMVMNKGT